MNLNTKSFWAGGLSLFHETPTRQIVGELALRVSLIHASDEAKQIEAWDEQIEILKQATSNCSSRESIGILLELPLTRIGKRIDTIITCPQGIICIEFKVGGNAYLSADISQTEDYALSLRSFHSASHSLPIFPVLCTTKATVKKLKINQVDGINEVWETSATSLSLAIEKVQSLESLSTSLDWYEYDQSAYNPTPSIIDAARLIYAGHNVEDLGRTDASKEDLTQAAETLSSVIARAQETQSHIVCFVSGEPGAGKTLLGLNLVFGGQDKTIGSTPAALLSGNRPLVSVLREAVASDAVKRTGIKKSQADLKTSQALQHLLGYLKEHLTDDAPPPENVIVFDEAQRAWDAKTGKKLLDRDASEPDIFLEIMGKLPWACLVCLVGPGQEINTGELGMSLWDEAIISANNYGRSWKAIASPETKDMLLGEGYQLTIEPSLYLASQLRAYKNAKHGHWVKALLDANIVEAKEISTAMTEPPAYISRDLSTVKKYLAQRSRGNHRVGLLASSGARRLIAEGIPPSPISKELKEVAHWFLKPSSDFRSSNALETPLSEYVSQGLEIDYAGLCWGNDLIWGDKKWIPRQMRAPKWTIIKNVVNAKFKLNAYRVLLTRSRAGLVIYVPVGSDTDATRSTTHMNDVYTTLIAAGCNQLT